MLFLSDEEDVAVICLVSKQHRSSTRVWYWFSFYRSQKDRLEEAEKGYLALGCGSPDDVVLIPIEDAARLSSDMNQTVGNDRNPYWHVLLYWEHDRPILHRRQGSTAVDLSLYMI